MLMYVYADSHFGRFRISRVYVYAYRWRGEYQVSAAFEFHRTCA